MHASCLCRCKQAHNPACDFFNLVFTRLVLVAAAHRIFCQPIKNLPAVDYWMLGRLLRPSNGGGESSHIFFWECATFLA